MVNDFWEEHAVRRHYRSEDGRSSFFSLKTLLNAYQFIRCHDPATHTVDLHRCANIVSEFLPGLPPTLCLEPKCYSLDPSRFTNRLFNDFFKLIFFPCFKRQLDQKRLKYLITIRQYKPISNIYSGSRLF